jgi:hypothetical protein
MCQILTILKNNFGSIDIDFGNFQEKRQIITRDTRNGDGFVTIA